jgi:hypothetical protein
MADAFGSSYYGGGGGGVGGGSPDIMKMILSLLGGGQTSPLLQTILEPLLQVQKRGFGEQTQNLEDIFRRAGALKGGSYGIAVPKLLGDQGLARSSLIGQTSASMLGPLLSALVSGRGQDMSMQELLAKINAGGGGGAGGGGLTDLLGSPSTLGPAGGAGAVSSYGGSGWNPTAPLNLDALISSLSGGGGGAGFGSQVGWSNPSDYLDYSQWTDSGGGGWY